MRSSFGPALVFVLLHLAFFHDVMVGGRTLSASTYVPGLTSPPSAEQRPHVLDVEGAAWVDEPSPVIARRSFRARELPLWGPDSGFGAPLAANLNSGAGNPLQLPLNLVATPVAADVFYMLRLLLLGLFTSALLRELGLASAAALLGGVVVAYGGYPLAWIAHHPLSSEVFLPLLLVGYERGRRGATGGWVLVALAVAGSLLGGKLQATILCVAFAAAWIAYRASARQGGGGAPTLGIGAVALGLGVALAAFLLVPAAELMVRASGLTLGGRAQLAGYTVPWPSLASVAMPTLFVPPDQMFAAGFLTPAIGVTAVVLAGAGAAAAASPLVHLARLCVLWAVVLLARNAGAFGELSTSLPAVRGILFVKYTFTIVFALGVAAAIGLDAVIAGRIAARSSRRVTGLVLASLVLLAAIAVASPAIPTFPARAVPSFAIIVLVAALTWGWAAGVVWRGTVATVLVASTVVELWMLAPHQHPPRRDPYHAPAFVEFLRRSPPGRVIADADLLVPLTSAAAGLHDVRAIDVLTPGTYYAFFTRLLSFCDRVIHFTVDPDVAVAATAPALDLAGVRWIVSRDPLPDANLARGVHRQAGRERTARLLAGLTRLRTEGAPLAIGPVTSGDDERFAFTLTTPFVFEVTAESEAPELAFGVLVRVAGSAVVLRIDVDGVASDASEEPVVVAAADQWQEQRIALADAGRSRRIRLRVVGSTAGLPATVSLGNVGFGGGAVTEARLASERAARHVAEAAHLRSVFQDPEHAVTVYENTNALPRAFRVTDVEPSPSADAAFTRLGDGFDFRRVALVDTAEVAAVKAVLADGGRAVPGTDDLLATAEIRAETPNAVTIATAGSTPAVLVLTDLAYPGWHADLDGRAARILTVNGLFRGVVVPAGAHVVTFRYRPTSLWVGLLVSVVAGAALVPYGRHASRRHHVS